MRFDLWTKQHGGQGIDRRKMHSFEFGHLRGDYLGLNIVLHSFVMQRWISMKDHTTLCLHAEFVVTHAKPPLSLISRWNKEHDVDFWQPPDISRSHLYRGTFPWTPTTAIYRAYTVLKWVIGLSTKYLPGQKPTPSDCVCPGESFPLTPPSLWVRKGIPLECKKRNTPSSKTWLPRDRSSDQSISLSLLFTNNVAYR